MKTTFSIINFGKQNTPAVLQTIGNYFLLIAAIGGALVVAPISSPVIATVGAWAAFAGTIGKMLTKLGGSTKTQNQP